MKPGGQRALLAALCAATCAQLAYSAENYVFGRMDVATGTLPSSIVAADFNGDRKQDFAVANFNDNTVTIFLQSANGTFVRTDYPVGPGPSALIVGDFDGDSDPDLVVVNNNCNNNNCGPATISVLINRGNGSFSTSSPYITGNTNPTAIVAADLNGDGKADLAISSAPPGSMGGPGSVSILLNQGAGTFSYKGNYPAGMGVGQLVAFRPGGSGTPSLAVINAPTLGNGSIAVLRGNADGSLQQPVFYPAGGAPAGMATADLNGDGNPDLAVINAVDDSVSIFMGRSDGTFAAKVDYPVPEGPHNVAIGDINGDHKLDLIVSASTAGIGGGAVAILQGNGDGTFSSFAQYPTGNNPIAIVAADFNGDGSLDVAFTNGDVARASILIGNGDGTFPVAVNYSADIYPLAVATGDVNGDGWPDVVVANYGANTVSVYLNTGRGNFLLTHTYPVGRQPRGIAIGDLNGDHRADLLVANSGDNSISVLLGNGNGTFQSQQIYATGAAPYGLAVGDLNGDRKLDVVAVNTGDDTISVLLGNGDGTLRPQTAYLTNAAPSSVAIADFNGDGAPDLAVADSGTPILLRDPGVVSVLLNRGDGTFAPRADYPAGYNPQSVVAADFNGDGKQDLALATNLDTNGLVAVLMGNGDGTFQPQTTYPEGLIIYGLVAGDFNNDGHSDLAVTSSQNNTAFILAGDGHGGFEIQGTYGSGLGPFAIAAGKFSPKPTPAGPDLVIVNEYSNSLSVLLNSQLNRRTNGNR